MAARKGEEWRERNPSPIDQRIGVRRYARQRRDVAAR
jgi:hypothetical protein